MSYDLLFILVAALAGFAIARDTRK